MGIVLKFIVSILISSTAFAEIPTTLKEKLPELLQQGLDAKKYVGLSVIVLDNQGDTFEAHFGYRDIENRRAPDSKTIYELGSITKPFARLALASQNQIKLEDPIYKYLPQNIRSPKPAGKDVTIRDLVTHTGIKFSVPCTVRISNPNDFKCFGIDLDPELTDPYKNTTREKLYDFVNEFSFTVDEFPQWFAEPGRFYSYSNSGYGLLGEILAEQNNTNFEEYLTSQILKPLVMDSTVIDMPCELDNSCENLANVYSKAELDGDWKKASLWHLPGMSAAGGLRSNIADMKKFLLANLAPESTDLTDVLTHGQSPLEGANEKHNNNICQDNEKPETHNCNLEPKSFYQAWETIPGKAFYHGGATGASQAMILFSKDRSLGIVVLTNSKVGRGEQTLYHYPNDVAVCSFQLAGMPLSSIDFCNRLK